MIGVVIGEPVRTENVADTAELLRQRHQRERQLGGPIRPTERAPWPGKRLFADAESDSESATAIYSMIGTASCHHNSGFRLKPQ